MRRERRELVVYVFAKPPRSGLAKTRLAATIGDDLAASLARAFLLDVWSVASALESADAVLAATDPAAVDYGLPDGIAIVDQGEGDLGARMERLLRRGLEAATIACVVGTDCPGIDASHFERACAALANHDVFLDPTRDGGFYLVAARVCPEGLFDDVPWSVPGTFDATFARLRSLGLSVAVGEGWFDVDDAEGLVHALTFGAALAANAPRTKAFLDANARALVRLR